MFLYNVAFSLEFISLGVGAFLISWAIYKSECGSHHVSGEDVRPVNVGTASGTSNVSRTSYSQKKCYGMGFAKAIGVIIIILAILNMIDTLYYTVKYRHFVTRMHDRIENKINQKFNNSNATPSSSSTMDNSGPDNTTSDSIGTDNSKDTSTQNSGT